MAERSTGDVRFPTGWDRYDRWTLHFLDPDLERAYRQAEQADGVKRAQATGLAAVGTWIVIAIVGPPVVGVPPGPTWTISAFMAAFNLVTAFLGRWATTYARSNAIGIVQQVGTAVGVLLVTAVNGIFATYGLAALMLVAVGSFALTRHPFVTAVPLAIVYGVLFALVALGVGLGGQLLLQLFILASALAGGCAGAYLLERSSRVAFAQGRLVTALHERVDQLLRQYFSPDLASTLIDDPRRAALGGSELEVTVLFADLRGYTAFSERTPPSQVVAMLNDAFGVVVPIVLGEGGTVIQFMGDAMMAIFNAPTPQPDHALRAARAALAMQQAIGDLETTEETPRFRVGINSGPALVGNIGAAEMRNFSAIGDTTNLAARLQTFAEEGSVVIGAGTYALLGDEAIVRPLGRPELKGKSQPVEVYELLGIREPATTAI
jgi:class 3 adenylate cyclase